MAEHVVEDVRLLQVIQLVLTTDEPSGRKAAVRQVVEEHLVGARGPGTATTVQPVRAAQPLVHATKVRNALATEIQRVEPL